MVDDQCRAHPRRFGDGSQPDTESVPTELFDGRLSDPGVRGQIG